jgi:hypothetical protein
MITVNAVIVFFPWFFQVPKGIGRDQTRFLPFPVRAV